MKRYGDLFGKLISFENLYQASRKARAGKRGKPGCAAFEMDIEEELMRLRRELADKTYRPGPYREFTIYESKERKISAAPYRDRVVHHALCNIIEPIFEKSFIYDSYACRPGKGTHAAVNRFTAYVRNYPYVLKMDIRKYFPSIDHEILYKKIAKKIKCPDTLWLIRLIIAGSNPQEEINEYFPGDDLFTPYQRRRGIPIGNLTSQFFANIYLNDLDHFIKEHLACPGYIRYVDDLTIFADDKKRLWEIAGETARFLQQERLTLHPGKTLVAPVTEGSDHLGYRVFPTHRRLRRDNVVRFRRKLKRLVEGYRCGRFTGTEMRAAVMSWIGHAAHADTWGLRGKILEREGYGRYRRLFLP
ncbi:MAG: hypothetical protein KBG09_08045 [Syntrophobacterales bacterium]|nr:hypothetical protein [Syntrophobacterales bacterium]